MPMKLLVARRTGRSVRFVVHLDTTKLLPDGKPDPAWTYAQSWTAPLGATPGWLASVRADLKVGALAALADVQEANDPGTALPQEGQTF